MKLKLVVISILLVMGQSFASETHLSVEKENKMDPWARLNVYPSNVDVWINNYDNRDYTCSGNVYMYLSSGRQEVQYYYKRVFARSHDYRSFRNYNYNDRIINASHTIRCY